MIQSKFQYKAPAVLAGVNLWILKKMEAVSQKIENQ